VYAVGLVGVRWSPGATMIRVRGCSGMLAQGAVDGVSFLGQIVGLVKIGGVRGQTGGE